jgi:hypothetical protein
VPHGAAANLSSAPGTLAPPRACGFRFGPAYPVSKLLKFFKLFGQRLLTETQGKHATVRLIVVTHIRANASIEMREKGPLQCTILAEPEVKSQPEVIVESKRLRPQNPTNARPISRPTFAIVPNLKLAISAPAPGELPLAPEGALACGGIAREGPAHGRRCFQINVHG